MSGYKLKYFDFKGRGELIRLLFALKGQAFEDCRIPFENWPKEKKETPFGWLPTLTVHGKTICDSMSIARYLAREFGYAGKNNLEQLEVDQVLGIVADSFPAIFKFYFEQDPAKKVEYKKEAFEQKLPNFFNALEKILTTNGTGFFVGNSITAADVAVFDLCDHLESNFINNYPKVIALLPKVTGNPNIKAYLSKRKPTDI